MNDSEAEASRAMYRHRQKERAKHPSPPPLPTGPDGWTKAIILFCGHDATFVADIIVTPFAVTIIAKDKIKLCFGNVDDAQWKIVDDFGGYWNPEKGRFVLPRNAVTRLKL